MIIEDEFKPSLLALEYINAFKLICASESWEWTSNKFVNGFVRSKLAELANQHRLNTASKKIVDLMAFYFMLKAVVVSFVCPREQFLKDVGSDILKSYEHELQNDQIGRYSDNDNDSYVDVEIYILLFCFIEFRVVQLAIIESLLSLSPFDPQRCMSIIESWISRLNDNARRILPDLIKTKINVVFTQHNKNSIF